MRVMSSALMSRPKPLQLGPAASSVFVSVQPSLFKLFFQKKVDSGISTRYAFKPAV